MITKGNAPLQPPLGIKEFESLKESYIKCQNSGMDVLDVWGNEEGRDGKMGHFLVELELYPSRFKLSNTQQILITTTASSLRENISNLKINRFQGKFDDNAKIGSIKAGFTAVMRILSATFEPDATTRPMDDKAKGHASSKGSSTNNWEIPKEVIMFLEFFFDLRRNADVSFNVIKQIAELTRLSKQYYQIDENKLLEHLGPKLIAYHGECHQWLYSVYSNPLPIKGLKKNQNPKTICKEIDYLFENFKGAHLDEYLTLYENITRNYLVGLRTISKNMLKRKGISLE